MARQRAFEEAAALSEEELRERVRRSIEELVPRRMEEKEEELTPAQVFYMENRERLVSRAQEPCGSRASSVPLERPLELPFGGF